jgi:hypothetical protein
MFGLDPWSDRPIRRRTYVPPQHRIGPNGNLDVIHGGSPKPPENSFDVTGSILMDYVIVDNVEAFENQGTSHACNT